MRTRASSFFWFSLAGTLWSCLAVGVAFVARGPASLSSSLPQVAEAQIAYATPPVDQRGMQRFVSGAGGVATAQVFWEQPTRARVKIKIELPAPEQPAPTPR
jgi:hypothetical protein